MRLIVGDFVLNFGIAIVSLAMTASEMLMKGNADGVV